MDAIERAVSNVQRQKEFKGMQHMRIDGSTPPQQRQRNVEKFQEDENCRVSQGVTAASHHSLSTKRALVSVAFKYLQVCSIDMPAGFVLLPPLHAHVVACLSQAQQRTEESGMRGQGCLGRYQSATIQAPTYTPSEPSLIPYIDSTIQDMVKRDIRGHNILSQTRQAIITLLASVSDGLLVML